jgi:hypothetical protein
MAKELSRRSTMIFKSKTQPLCHYCGKAIRKYTTLHFIKVQGDGTNISESEHWRYIVVADKASRPRTKAECQMLTNLPVVSVSYNHRMDEYDGERKREAVSTFTSWDGESYEDEFFCKGDHAKAFGRLMAKAGRCTSHYNEALAKQQAALASPEKT